MKYRKVQRFYAGIVNDINALCRKHDTWVRIYHGGANVNSSMKEMRIIFVIIYTSLWDH